MKTAINSTGKMVYLLAQSYMPAQSIHVLKNPGNATLSPWYYVGNAPRIDTPEWIFFSDQLYMWEKIT